MLQSKAIALAAALAGWMLLGAPAGAQSPAAQRGLVFVRVHCAQCHAIDAVSDSPIKLATPFRELYRKYPIDDLRRPLSEGTVSNHPTMPQFRLEPDQLNDVIAYLKSFER